MAKPFEGVHLLAALAALSLVGVAQAEPFPKMTLYTEKPKAGSDPGIRIEDGRGYFWSGEELRKRLGGNVPTLTSGGYGATTAYNVLVVARPSGPVEQAPSEYHEDLTQIYFIVSGTGAQNLGGQPTRYDQLNYGHRSATGPLVGAQSYRIAPGDMIIIPPSTWHQTVPDAGQTVVYQMVNIFTRRRVGP